MRILIAEDDPMLADGLTVALRQSGYTTDRVTSGLEADTALAAQQFDLLILDIGLPGLDGFQVLRRLRERKTPTPVLILTALDGVENRVHGLDLGADDYLTKPFDLKELEARVRALTRRAQGQVVPQINHGRLSYDPANRIATVDGAPLELSGRETALLEILLNRIGRVVSKDTIIDLMFQWGDEVSQNAVEVYIHRLRKKLEFAGASIATVRGLGYRITAPPPGAPSDHP